MSAWHALQSELDAWSEDGRTATLWWRDDDAVTETRALSRLCDVAGAHGVGLCIAAIPADVRPDILARNDWPDGSAILQHGYAHQNHAPDGEKKSEFGADRGTDDIVSDLGRGWSVISRSLNALAAFVPPWNRIGNNVIKALPDLGFFGLSTFGPRKQTMPVGGLYQTNTHVDPIDWRGHRGYVGDDAAISQMIAHLSARRTGSVDAMEPTGILTHHLVHDDACWRFVETIAQTVADHPAARWLRSDEVFVA